MSLMIHFIKFRTYETEYSLINETKIYIQPTKVLLFLCLWFCLAPSFSSSTHIPVPAEPILSGSESDGSSAFFPQYSF